jgi:hypothetical protein
MNVLYANGHVDWLERKEAEQLLARLDISGAAATRP